jgi:SAM-dependent methyltransferase
VRKHGLVVLEAHCVAPRIARRHLGATHSVAFDAYHGLSHQFPIDHAAFVHCCRKAGLRPESHFERRYPANRPFVAVSLNRLVVPSDETVLPALRGSAPRADTWQPEPGTDLEDGRALHDLLYIDTDLRYPRPWCSAATGFVVAGALEAVEERLAGAGEGDVIRVLDYGAGTGLASIELLKACRERGVEERLERLGATLEVHLADLPSSWFAQGFELLRECAWTRFHSVRADGGGFRPLPEVTGGLEMDAVMANMVFHLIPTGALGRVAADLAAVTRRGGRLLWSAPDLGPAGPYAVLFHDANRALRGHWLGLLRGESPPSHNGARSDAVRDAVERARRSMDERATREAAARAARRVLPRANDAEAVAQAIAGHFTGDQLVERPTHELQADDIIDTLLVPSNQAEYLPEIPDRALREQVVRELMLGQVIPDMQEQPAGTALGVNVQWTLGAAVR